MKRIIFFFFSFFLICAAVQAQINIGGIKIGGGKGGGITVNAEDLVPPSDPHYNPGAPADYDANLASGDSAMAIDEHYGVKSVKIRARVAGMYCTVPLGVTEWEMKNKNGMTQWYKANSVYPVYLSRFSQDMRPYEQVMRHYLQCYATKHSLTIAQLTPFDKWTDYYLSDIAEVNQHRAKLTELEALLKSKYPEAANTGLRYDLNPAVWAEIATGRDQYIKCLAANSNGDMDRTMKTVLSGIEAAKKQVEAYDGKNDLYRGESLEWIWRAVSQKRRQEFFTTWTPFASFVEFAKATGKDPEAPKAATNAALDELAKLVAPKLPSFKMPDSYFKYRDAASEAVMKAYLKNPGGLKIHRTGLSDPDWLIAKNDIGFPLYRYKRGQMLVRNPSDDHPYCKGLFFVVKQEYAGGGTYGKTQVSEYHEELYGCP